MLPLIAVLGVAAGGAQFAAQSSAASAQGRYARELQIRRNEQYRRQVQYQRDLSEWQHKRYKATADSAMRDADSSYAAVLDGLQQRRKKIFDSIAQYEMKANQDVSRYMASEGRSETTGQSVALAQMAALQKASREKQISHDNLEGYIRQGNRQFLSIRANAQNRINAAMPSPLEPIYPGDAVRPVYQPGGADLAAAVLPGITNALALGYQKGD